MSNRIDRSLGVKPYSNKGGSVPVVRGSLKASSFIKGLLILAFAAGIYHCLHSTATCHQGVRCAD